MARISNRTSLYKATRNDAPQSHSPRGFLTAPPPVTVSQMVLAPLLIGILLGIWFVPVEVTRQGVYQVFLANQKPTIAIFGHNSVRFVDAESNRELCRSEPVPQTPMPKRGDLSQWYRWPNRENLSGGYLGVYSPFFQRVDGLDFLADDSIAIVSQGDRLYERNYTVVHLPTGKRYVQHEQPRTNYGPIEFARLDEFVVAVQRKDGPLAQDAPLGFPPMVGHKSILGEVVLAIDPQTGPVELTDEQKKRALSAFAVRRWQHQRGIWNSQPIEIPKEDQAAANSDQGIEFCERDTKPIAWATSSGRWIEYANSGRTVSDSASKYWLIDSRSAPLARAKWPFKVGETFERSATVPNDPVVCGILRCKRSISSGIVERSVCWNLETGRVINLPETTSDARRFGNRLLLCNSSGAIWVNLNSGKLERRVVNLDTSKHPRFAYAVVLWLAAWFYGVRPVGEGDLSRRFGACFFLLGVTAISVSQLDRLGLHYEWPQVEWLASCAILAVILAILLTVSVRRCVSWLLLGVAWPITLLLIASLAFESSAETYENPNSRINLAAWSKATLRATVWRHLTERGGFDRGHLDPAETPDLSMTWNGEPNFGVRRVEE